MPARFFRATIAALFILSSTMECGATSTEKQTIQSANNPTPNSRPSDRERSIIGTSKSTKPSPQEPQGSSSSIASPHLLTADKQLSQLTGAKADSDDGNFIFKPSNAVRERVADSFVDIRRKAKFARAYIDLERDYPPDSINKLIKIKVLRAKELDHDLEIELEFTHNPAETRSYLKLLRNASPFITYYNDIFDNLPLPKDLREENPTNLAAYATFLSNPGSPLITHLFLLKLTSITFTKHDNTTKTYFIELPESFLAYLTELIEKETTTDQSFPMARTWRHTTTIPLSNAEIGGIKLISARPATTKEYRTHLGMDANKKAPPENIRLQEYENARSTAIATKERLLQYAELISARKIKGSDLIKIRTEAANSINNFVSGFDGRLARLINSAQGDMKSSLIVDSGIYNTSMMHVALDTLILEKYAQLAMHDSESFEAIGKEPTTAKDMLAFAKNAHMNQAPISLVDVIAGTSACSDYAATKGMTIASDDRNSARDTGRGSRINLSPTSEYRKILGEFTSLDGKTGVVRDALSTSSNDSIMFTLKGNTKLVNQERINPGQSIILIIGKYTQNGKLTYKDSRGNSRTANAIILEAECIEGLDDPISRILK